MDVNHIEENKIFDIQLEPIFVNVNILRKLETASRYIGEVNNIVSNVLDFDFIITALKNIEALNSSRIEGTTGNLKDLYLESVLDFEEKKQLKLFSAVNYKVTMSKLEDTIKKYNKFDNTFICHIHKLLTENDPATRGVPGMFRNVKVKIENSKLGDFYPPHQAKIPEYMLRFVKDIEARNSIPSLFQVAATHFQFESIHPFEDGNGRSGRILIIAQLILNGTLESAILNLSQYFDIHRDEYVSALRSVSDKGDYTHWFEFFLDAIICQSKRNIDLIQKLRDLKENNEEEISKNVGSPAAHHVLSHLLNKLYITVEDTEAYLRRKKVKGKELRQMARNNILSLEKLKILQRAPFKKGRSQMYVHSQLKDTLMRQPQP